MVDTTSFTLPESPEVLAVAEPPTRALLVLRSNVVAGQLTINGKEYGATRLDLDLEQGQYDVTISKPGFKPSVTESPLIRFA